MRNRAKCKLCKSVIESFHRYDYVTCKCGEISVDGGNDYFKCSAKDVRNFLRVDDEDNEITVEWKDSIEVEKEVTDNIVANKPSRKEMLEELDRMVENMDRLPPHAMTLPITHYDFYSALLLLSSILREE